MLPLGELQVVGRVVSTGEVTQIETQGSAIRAVDELINPPALDTLVAPGFIDLQVNGFAGVDYNDPASTTEQIAASIRAQFSTGVTKLLPTIITASAGHIISCLQNLTKAVRELESADRPERHGIAGYHIEGPHLSPEDGPRGAHPLEDIRPPDIGEFYRWQEAANGLIKLVTVSPEWPETPVYVRELVRNGVVASVGHTKATSEQIQAAVDAGARMSTHLGNAAHPVLPKLQNYIWDQLANERLMASFILDGIHIPPHFAHAAMRAKGMENCILVTDAVAPAMCEPGPYKLSQVEVELRKDGSVRMRGTERLAGSALRMDHAIANTVRYAGATLRHAILMATQNAARAGRIAGRQRGIVPGEKADVVAFLWNPETLQLSVQETIVDGISVYRA